jgi:hypothetical protein
MKPSKTVIQQVLSGKTIIRIGNKGYYWKVYKYPAHLTFKTENKWELELERPFNLSGKKDIYTLTISKLGGCQFLWRESGVNLNAQ